MSLDANCEVIGHGVMGRRFEGPEEWLADSGDDEVRLGLAVVAAERSSEY